MTVQYCPKCGGIIIEDDMYDTEFSKEEIITQHCGHCPKSQFSINGKTVLDGMKQPTP